MDLSRIAKLKDLEIQGRRVLVRVDFNVPMANGEISDDTRIRAALPTIDFLLQNDARVILMSHLGRPKGKPDPALSLEPVAMRLAELLEVGEVFLTDSCVGDGARSVVSSLREGQVCVLENLRFHEGETRNDDKLVRELASFADIYVNDAFGSSHRAHASTEGVPRLVRIKAAGLLLEKEIKSISALLGEVERPFVAVLGGAKVTDKLAIIESLLTRVNTLIIGGAMANTFLAARGKNMGKSLVESDKFPLARDILARAESKGVNIVLPVDLITSDSQDSEDLQTVSVDAVSTGMAAFDVGPDSSRKFKDIISRAATVFWNGPMGMFEKAQFAEGTVNMARAISGSSAYSVVGGGDSVAAVRQAGLEKRFNHVSTGGGASLEMLEGKILPGIAALIG